MSESNNNNKESQTTHNYLDVAQISLGVGALFGLLAVVELVVLAWQFALVMMSLAIALAGLIVALVLLTIPSEPPRQDITPKGDPSVPKQPEVEGTYRFVHSTQQILKSRSEKDPDSSIKPGHFSSPLFQTDNSPVKTDEPLEQNNITVQV